MSIVSLDVIVACNRCGVETTAHLSPLLWPENDYRVVKALERLGWIRFDGGDICPGCQGPTKEDVADYRAYHAGEGIHTP